LPLNPRIVFHKTFICKDIVDKVIGPKIKVLAWNLVRSH